MHWAERIADQLIRSHPDKEEFHCASGTTPSGPVHCGNLRDILTNWNVAKCLMERGKKVKLIQSWDDYDRFRKVPKNVPESYAEHLGRAVADVPDPWEEYPSYAARYERQFERSLVKLHIDLEYRYQAQVYRSGAYNYAIVEAIEKRKDIYDIISSFRTQKGTDEERERYFPVEIYCEVCNRDTTRLTEIDYSSLDFRYSCKCGFENGGNAATATNLKLPWKIDWAMRWRHERVDFEPAGKDHGTAGGSFEVASEIARKVFLIEPPTFQVYEFLGIKGLAGKMSGSSGNVITLDEALEIYQPEVLLWIFARIHPNRAFDLVVDRQIYQVYDEFDRAAADASEEGQEEHKATKLSAIAGRVVYPVPFRQLASFSGIVRGNLVALEEMFRRIGTPYPAAQFSERLEKAANWVHKYAPEEDCRLVEARRGDYFASMTAERQQWIRDLHAWVAADEITQESAGVKLYEIPAGTADSDKKKNQKVFFQDIYALLFGRSSGPRLGTFLAAVPKGDYLHLLEF